jgi:hypothetical protein
MPRRPFRYLFEDASTPVELGDFGSLRIVAATE